MALLNQPEGFGRVPTICAIRTLEQGLMDPGIPLVTMYCRSLAVICPSNVCFSGGPRAVLQERWIWRQSWIFCASLPTKHTTSPRGVADRATHIVCRIVSWHNGTPNHAQQKGSFAALRLMAKHAWFANIPPDSWCRRERSTWV